MNYASIPGRSRLGLNSRQVRTGPQFQAGPDWASTCPPLPEFLLYAGFAGFTPSPGLRAAGLHPFTRGLRAAGLHPFTPSPGGCGLHPFTPSPGGCGLHPFTPSPGGCGLHPFTPSPGGVAGCGASLLHRGFGVGASPLHPGFAGCGASPLHLGLGASRTQISEFSGSGIGVKIRGSPFKRGGHSGHVAAV